MARSGLLAALCLVLVPAGASALAPNTPDPTAFVTNGSVGSIARGNGVTYIGGSFSRVGPRTGAFVEINRANGQRVPPFPDVGGGHVIASVPDGEGGFYVGGTFTHAGGFARDGLAHITKTGAVDPDFDAGTITGVSAGIVVSLALDDSGETLYVGGNFSFIGGANRSNVAALSTNTGDATGFLAGAGATGGSDPSVSDIELSGSKLFVGGQFTSIGGQSRTNLAEIDTAAGTATAFNPSPNDRVQDLNLDGAKLYVAGEFTTIDSQSRNRIARVDDEGDADSFNPTSFTGFRIERAEVSEATGTVYVAGSFSNIGGAARDDLAALNPSTGAATGFDPNPDSSVGALAVTDAAVYAGGQFDNIGGQPRANLAELDPSTGAATSFDPSPDDIVFTLDATRDSLFVGGGFQSVNGVARSSIAALNDNGVVTAWNPVATGSVNALAVSGGAVYAGGNFTAIGGQPQARLAKLSATSGNAFQSFDANVANGQVNAIVTDGSNLYVGGTFFGANSIGGQPRNRIAKLSASSGNAFSAWNPNANNTVLALALSGTSLYVGGQFNGTNSIGGADRNRIAKLSTASGNAFSAWNPNASGTVTTILVSASVVYVGGEFIGANSIGGQSRNRLAKLSASSGNAFSAWNPNVDGSVGSRVRALALNGAALYVGGTFQTVGGQPRSNLAAVSTTSGNPFNGFNPGDTNGSVSSLVRAGKTLYAGGSFDVVAGRGVQSYAQFTEP